jgi:hypothetical protein
MGGKQTKTKPSRKKGSSSSLRKRRPTVKLRPGSGRKALKKQGKKLASGNRKKWKGKRVVRGGKKKTAYRISYDQGYKEGFSKGFEDAHQEGYRSDTGDQPPLSAGTQPVVPPEPPQVELLPPSDKPIPAPAEAHIGILYVCTGKYHVFWEDFFKSSEAFFLPGTRKTYYVLTDAAQIYADDQENVRRVFHDNLGWPGNTLMRFAMFRNLEGSLLECDYIFFFNANMLFLQPVGEEILPAGEGLLAVKHPGYFNVLPDSYSYDRNPASLAYIPLGSGVHYFMGGLTGGRTIDYLNMVRVLDERIKSDIGRGVIAVWHDESHLNQYLLDKSVKVLEPSYGYPEGVEIPFHPIILIRDKNKWGGHEFLRT